VAVALALAVGLVLPGPGVGAQVEPEPYPLLPVPDPLPPGDPGTVIDSAASPVDGFPFAVEAHQVLYRSTDRFGGTIAVSGILVVPTGVPAPPGGRPVVAWNHGTSGITDGCAPSIWGAGLTDGYSSIGTERILAAGGIVVATDYPGMGTPGVHPYLDGISEGRAVLDAIRAARAWGGTGPAAITGFSQGGHATLYAGAEQPGYAPDIDLRAVVPIAAPTLLSAAYAATGDLGNADQYAGIILTGIVAARPDLDRTELLTAAGEDAYDELAAADADPSGPCWYSAFDGMDLDDAIRADPLTLPDWRAALVENEPGSRPIPVPVLMIAARDDSTVPDFMTEVICQAYTRLGTDLRLWMYDEGGHSSSPGDSADDRTTWILDRLAGQAPVDEVAWTGDVPEVRTACVPTQTPGPEDPDDQDPEAIPPGPAAPAVPVSGTARFTG
jgi:dienelactone hydrolase